MTSGMKYGQIIEYIPGKPFTIFTTPTAQALAALDQ